MKILKNTDTTITETFLNADGTNVTWADVVSFKIILKGNNTTIEADTNTDTDGQFIYYIPEDFTRVNSTVSPLMELSFANANFSDGTEDVRRPLYDYVIEITDKL